LWEHEFECKEFFLHHTRICLVVVVLYKIHELDKSIHLKAFSLKISFQGYVQAQSRENWLLMKTYLWVSLLKNM
jgi:hypothetical protein